MARSALADRRRCHPRAQVRGRCIMTTYDPDTLEQDRNILRLIVRELDGRMALDCPVLQGGLIREGAPVILVED